MNSKLYKDICSDINHPIRVKIREQLITKIKLLDEQMITHPEGMYAFFRDSGVEPCYTSNGQFCGGIESEWYKKDGRVYKFMIEDGNILDAISQNDI